MKRIVAVGVVILALLVAGGIVWLANARLAPPAETVEQTVPDDNIPH